MSLRSTASGLYIPHVKSFDSVFHDKGRIFGKKHNAVFGCFGLYIPHVKSFDSVERGQVLADIIDPLTGVTVAQTEAPEDGIVFFAKDSPLVMENETLFKIVNKLHK